MGRCWQVDTICQLQQTLLTMADADFLTLLNQHYNISSINELSGKQLRHYTFASTSNARAIRFIKTLESVKQIDWQNCNVLDVGCAYGGFAIETAKLGATSYGIDIVEKNHRLALENAKSLDLNVDFKLLDATHRKIQTEFEDVKFDVIILNDVFEHVYNTTTLLENLSAIAASNCMLYFAIPNGTAIQYVKKEGHYDVPGVVLLSPANWQYFMKMPFNAFYRPISYYFALFEYTGFKEITLFDYGCNDDKRKYKKDVLERVEEMQQALHVFIGESDAPLGYKNHLKNQIRVYIEELNWDLDQMPLAQFKYKYDIAFWKGFAVKTDQLSNAYNSIHSNTPITRLNLGKLKWKVMNLIKRIRS